MNYVIAILVLIILYKFTPILFAKKAAKIALEEITPISDARGSAEYKSLLLRNLLFAHFEKFFPNLIVVEELI